MRHTSFCSQKATRARLWTDDPWTGAVHKPTPEQCPAGVGGGGVRSLSDFPGNMTEAQGNLWAAWIKPSPIPWREGKFLLGKVKFGGSGNQALNTGIKKCNRKSSQQAHVSLPFGLESATGHLPRELSPCAYKVKAISLHTRPQSGQPVRVVTANNYWTPTSLSGTDLRALQVLA